MWAPTKKSGFTIVELLIVIIVIGVLSALVLVGYSGVTKQAKIASITADLTQAAKVLASDQYKSLNSQVYPSTLALANGGSGITASNGNTYVYAPSPSNNPTSYCLASSNGSLSYFILSSGGGVQQGDCSGQGLAGWWKLNGNATDSSGNNNTGTFTGTPTPTTGQNGSANGAYTFNGNYITFSSLSSKLSGSSSFSVTGWVKPANNPSSYNSFFGYRNDSTTDFYVLQLQGTNTLECRFRNSDTNYFNPNAPVATVTPAVWQLVSFVYDGSTAICYTYSTQTGSVLQQTQAPASGSPSTSGPFSIGALNGTNAMTGGSIDDVRLYTRALSSAEIQALFNQGAQ